MWKSIVANAWRYGPRQYIHRERYNTGGGKIDYNITEIDNVPLQISTTGKDLFQDKNGHHVNQNFTVRIPRYFFDEHTFFPSLDDEIVIDGVRYRVISIEDIYMQPHFDIVNLTVRREEIAY